MIEIFDTEKAKILGELLLERSNDKIPNRTIGTAESCTAGRISACIASVSGASKYHKGGIVSYATEVKEKVLGVNHQTIMEHDVVSEKVAIEMAKGCHKVLDCSLAISITGYAGETGGNDKVPNGTIWICCFYAPFAYTKTIRLDLHAGRESNLRIATDMAMALAIETLNECKNKDEKIFRKELKLGNLK